MAAPVCVARLRNPQRLNEDGTIAPRAHCGCGIVWDGVVLRKSSDKVRHCYQRAAEARERAMRATDASVKSTWFKIEDRWITIAQSHTMSEALVDFAAEIRRSIKRDGER